MLAEIGMTEAPKPSQLDRLRSRHHWIAQLLAEETPVIDVAAITGMSIERINFFKEDPAFKELMEHYRQQAQVNFGTAERISHLGLTVLETLQERLENEPEKISTKDLIAMGEFTMDRSGFGKSSTLNVRSLNVNDFIKELRTMSAQERALSVIPREEEAGVDSTITVIEGTADVAAEQFLDQENL